MVEKVKSFMIKIFSGKNKKNSLIAIVALIQCIILIAVTSYSWIESQSSLIIKGDNLPINSNLNYRFDVDTETNSIVDLSTYFRPTALYQLAQASTSDGKNFYFKTDENKYRLGDTTDYNTSYYNFDFQIHNTSRRTYNYFFESENIFDVTSDNKDVTPEMLTIAEKAMRVSVTSGVNTENVRIYSIDSKNNYNAVYTKSGGTKSTSSVGLSGNSEYKYNTANKDPNTFVFSTTGGGDDTKVTIKVWFEERDAEYQALTSKQKEDLLGSTVKINIRFMNSASVFQSFYFDDYTFSIKDNHKGEPVTTEDDAKSLFFYYQETGTDNSVIKTIIPMVKIDSTDTDVIHWVTASAEGDPTPRISDDMKNKLETNPENGYFFYGTYNAQTGAKTEDYKWPIKAPAANNAGGFVFKALSVLNANSGSVGYGVWDNVPIELYKFSDMTTSATANVYNKNSFRFINQSEGYPYITKSTTASIEATRLYYDAESDLWIGYFDKLDDTFTTPIFSYAIGNFADNYVKVQWSASNPIAHYEGEKIYTALGYEGIGSANSQKKATGVGTWAKVEEIKFSTELVDATMNKDNRYKIGASVGGNYVYYYMAVDDNATHFKAYVPENSGNASDNIIKFQRFNGPDSDELKGTWNSTDVLRNGSNTFYATDTAATTSSGQWHIAVVVDGSVDNVVNDVLTNVSGAKLEYSVDGGKTYIEMNKLDNYRWYTNDFGADVKNVKYKWTAYPKNEEAGINEAVFTYGHDMANGIYFNITE